MSTKLLWWKWLQRSTIIITRTVSTHTKHTFILNIKLLEIKGQKQKIIQRKMASHAMLLRLNPDAMRENNPTPTPRETGVEWTVFTYKNLIGSYIWWCNNISCNVFNTSSYVGMGFSAELVSLQWSFSDFEQSSLLNEYHWMDIIITLFSVFFFCVCVSLKYYSYLSSITVWPLLFISSTMIFSSSGKSICSPESFLEPVTEKKEGKQKSGGLKCHSWRKSSG